MILQGWFLIARAETLGKEANAKIRSPFLMRYLLGVKGELEMLLLVGSSTQTFLLCAFGERSTRYQRSQIEQK